MSKIFLHIAGRRTSVRVRPASLAVIPALWDGSLQQYANGSIIKLWQRFHPNEFPLGTPDQSIGDMAQRLADEHQTTVSEVVTVAICYHAGLDAAQAVAGGTSWGWLRIGGAAGTAPKLESDVKHAERFERQARKAAADNPEEAEDYLPPYYVF